jgi:hypothetical protein
MFSMPLEGSAANWHRFFLGLPINYMSPDPAMRWASVGLTGDPYTYAKGNPLVYVDPDGMEPGFPYSMFKGKAIDGFTKFFESAAGVTDAEAKQLAQDIWSAATNDDVKQVKDSMSNAPQNMNDLSPAARDVLNKLLNQMPAQDKAAVDKLKKASSSCPPKK